ncbi:putative disease resistance protein At4g19050 [Pistacia vera]|uniref:putative disease resistance protein At4g19050 n=1 Tax=Pistacia vera TaxID=55513 RepID=UPI001263864F|nr:putative disease resistance protein At4g19050 [Pistacia vera]
MERMRNMQITLGPSLAFFRHLQVLNVIKCRKLMKLMRPSTARSLVQLRELRVEGCEMVIEIVENEGDATTSTEFVFENLKKLLFRMLETLVCFCFGNYSFNFPSLEKLTIRECANMKTFSKEILSTPKLHKVNYESFNETNKNWGKIKEVENEGNDLNKTIQGEYKKQEISLELKLWTFKDINSTEISYNQHPTSFYQSLTHLFLWNCGNIKYAFPSSIAKSLHQLQQLMIRDCKVLEEIVAKEEGANAVVNFVFPNITLLKLQNLPKLATFYLRIHTSKWPMLKELVVRDCENFTSKHMSFQEDGEEGELHISEPKSLFLDDKINHDLEVFNITNDWKEIIWNSQSKALEIEYDDSIDFPLGLLQRFENLKKLQLYHCDQFQELFFPNLPNLEVLDLLSCSKLTSLVPSSASFQNLEVMTVHDCNGFMMKLITPSTAKNLVHLREMSIKHCYLLIEIVENEGEGDTTMSTEIVFDNLKKLSLVCLDSLTCFCSGNYSFNFPSLEELNIKFCPNIKTFSQGISNTPKLHKVIYVSSSDTITREETEVENRGNGLNTNIQQAHKKEVDSNLKELTLSGSDIMSIRKGEFQESFGKVKTLRLINDAYANIPIQILPKLNSLENLILKMSSYEEIFLFEEDKEHIETLTKLKNLELFGLLDLKCIWKQDSRLNSILQNLDSLEVKYCHKLTTMLPSLASFENLRILKVSYCNEMQNLMSSSTAKSLVRLEYLSIESCEMMIEILANEGDIEKGITP